MPRYKNHEWKPTKRGLQCLHCKTFRRPVYSPMRAGASRLTLYKHQGKGRIWTTERPKCIATKG